MDGQIDRWALFGFPQKIRNSLNKETIQQKVTSVSGFRWLGMGWGAGSGLDKGPGGYHSKPNENSNEKYNFEKDCNQRLQKRR